MKPSMMFCAAAALVLLAQPAGGQDAEDPLGPFLRDLADSTDAFFGRSAASFDTTGIDSLIRISGGLMSEAPGSAAARRFSTSKGPVVGFHRSTGLVLGVKTRAGDSHRGWATAQLSYGFANKEGRYRAALASVLAGHESAGGPRHLVLEISYSRETLPFAPEHACPVESAVGTLLTGRDRQSVYERRGGSVQLTWSDRSFIAGIGWRRARDQSMPTVSRFKVLGAGGTLPAVTPTRPGSFKEGFAEFSCNFLPVPRHLGVEAGYASRDRWRARLAAAHDIDRFGFKVNVQCEWGVAARNGPQQSRFEIGGPLAVPSLGLGDESGNRLLLGKTELIRGIDLLKALHVPHPSMLVLHPAIFIHGACVWTESEGRWSAPPAACWRGAAGVALLHLPGIILPASYVRLQMAWPLGLESGVARFSVALGRWHDLAPKR